MLEFEKRDRPADMLQLVKRLYNAEGIMLTAPDADAVVRHVSRVSAKLLEGYPGGQMLAHELSVPGGKSPSGQAMSPTTSICAGYLCVPA